MRYFKNIFEFYINSSIHVALSCFALVHLTYIMFHISYNTSVAFFTFFGTIVGYNFVKYDALVRSRAVKFSAQLQWIAFLSFLSLIATGYCFFHLEKGTQIIGFVFLIIVLLYTLPFFPNKKNARNWAGIKIYIVALCWVGVTLFLPIVNNNVEVTSFVFLVAIQRYIMIFVLILIFEIVDLKLDDPNLKTVPQQIGVQRTKQIGVVFMVLFVLLEFLSNDIRIEFLALKTGLAITTILFLVYANENRSRYYASFWVESIPVFWWLFLMFFS
ncbi:hypothetical protein DNC80_01090 [Flavobacterium sp. SOK18b]|uniref:hypothetical protein n=1 Tax=Flavobacterium sp. SOK18b TaxID=797900 RepID=UPI0015FCF4C5|nr:hypothetical protein [Flavobacterium sp. SOK18b]MBB1192266.1 hypothetical protein [Flavobacterium sp. SOK18b]